MKNDLRSNQRVAILVDGSNIYKSSKEKGVKVDYSKVLERLNDRHLVRAIFYHPEDGTSKEACFLKRIRSMGFEVRTKELRRYPDGKVKADMDLDIAIDAVSLADKVDVICLLSGDGDYVPLINYLKGRGVRTEAMAFKRNTSRELKSAVDGFFPITPDLFRYPQNDCMAKQLESMALGEAPLRNKA